MFVIWTWIPKNVFIRLGPRRFGVHEVVLYVSDGATKARGLRAGPNTVSASKQTDVERIQSGDIATELKWSKKDMRAHKIRFDTEYDAGKH
jgi:hypothetical protein